MKNLFLCSYFAGVKDIFKDFMNNTEGKKVLFIPTANIDEETKFLVDEAKEVFKSLGMEVENLEISKLDEKTIKNKIEKADYLYIGGGNTFYLLQELKRKNLIHIFSYNYLFISKKILLNSKKYQNCPSENFLWNYPVHYLNF